jgi:UDP-N-acetylmuramate--alanine ligase
VVAEADESDASFLRLEPEIAVVTNLELDHHSRWSSLAELTEAFAAFASPASGLVIDAGLELPGGGRGHQVRFALEAQPSAEPARAAGLVAEGIEAVPGGGMRFRARGEEITPEIDTDVSLTVPGRHNVANALAALGAIALSGTDVDAAAEALGGFGGVSRRMELKGERAGARIYDDYAHHPTEVRATLEAARELAPGRVIAAFQPHLYSRTKALATEFGAALAAADEVAVLDVYPAREEPVGPLEGVSGRLVAEAAADHAGGRPVWWLPDAELAARALGPRLAEGDVLLTIGAGDVFRLADALVAGDWDGSG